MLAMMSVTVGNVFLFAFQLFIFYTQGAPKIAGPGVNYPLLSLSTGLGGLITR